MCRDFKRPVLMRIKWTHHATPRGTVRPISPQRRLRATKRLGSPPRKRAYALLRAVIPQRASAASSLTRASTQRAPSGVCSFFQNGAWVFR